MGEEMYILLLIIGCILIGLNIKAINSEKKKSENFQYNMEIADENTHEVDFKLIELRSEMAKTVTELQREIVDLRNQVKTSHSQQDNYDTYIEEDITLIEEEKIENKLPQAEEKSKVSSSENNSVKVHKIKELLNMGLNEEEVAKELNIGKGEVLLIKELYM